MLIKKSKFKKILIISAFGILVILSIFTFLKSTSAQIRSDCWSKTDCEKESCGEACFEENVAACGTGRGFCYSQPIPTVLSISLPGLGEVHDPAQYISAIYEWGVSITGILAGIMIMIGGLLYLTAGGSSERVSNAKEYISHALIGLVLAMTSYLILQTINPALLGLKYPKVKLIPKVGPIANFCEDLIERDIKVTPVEPGKTKCGDLGIPQADPTKPEEALPTKCTYQQCENPEEACVLCTDPICAKPADCYRCAGVRLDGALAKFQTPFDGTLGVVLEKRRNLGKEICEKFKIKSNGPIQYRCELADGQNILDETVIDSFVSFLDDVSLGMLIASGKFRVAIRTELTMALGDYLQRQGPAAAKVGEILETAGRAERGARISLTVVQSIIKGNPIMLVLQAIVGGTVAAVKEAYKTFIAPSVIVGQKATCALAKIDCSKISKCQDYENITFEGQTTIKLTELTNPNQKIYLMDHLARFWDTYCTENPCHLPLQCAPSIQDHHYWYPNEINPSFNPDEAEIADIWGAAYPKKCVPVEMVATSWRIYSVSTVSTPTGWDTSLSEQSSRFDNGIFRWLITGKTLAKDVPREKIFPLVYSFQPKTQKRGQLCRTDQDCAEGLTCRGETVTYNNVYVYSGEGTPVSLMKSTTARPETVTYQRCY